MSEPAQTIRRVNRQLVAARWIVHVHGGALAHSHARIMRDIEAVDALLEMLELEDVEWSTGILQHVRGAWLVDENVMPPIGEPRETPMTCMICAWESHQPATGIPGHHHAMAPSSPVLDGERVELGAEVTSSCLFNGERGWVDGDGLAVLSAKHPSPPFHLLYQCGHTAALDHEPTRAELEKPCPVHNVPGMAKPCLCVEAVRDRLLTPAPAVNVYTVRGPSQDGRDTLVWSALHPGGTVELKT